MVGQIYSAELQFSKENSFNIEAPFIDLDLCIINGIIVLSKIYDERDDHEF